MPTVRVRVSERVTTWAALVALLAVLVGACWRALQPPAPLPADAPPDRFSEGRARAVVRHLADDIGMRVNGTPNHARAAEWLAAELRKIPGLEVEQQIAADAHVFRSAWLPVFVYRTVNVVARLPGRSPEAILLNAHFDTLTDSFGAADDASGVAAIVEAIRVLAREAPFEHSIVVNLNGAEESGLLGAAGFLNHRWARDVRAYLYLEALPAGRAVLFGANPWLAATYARVAPAPIGTVVGEDLMASGLLPHNGDFTPFHEAGLHGLDVAMSGDGWAYHDLLDRPERLQPGSLQHMGDIAVAVTRALASGPFPDEHAGARDERVVFYDVLGVAMATYRARTGTALAIAALILAAVALAFARRRSVIGLRAVLAALGWTSLALVAGVVAALLAGLLLGRVLGRPNGWFSTPALVLPAFAAPALAAMFGVHALWHRRAARPGIDAERHAFAAWAGALLFWSVWLVLATVKQIGAGYLALHWVWPLAVGMIGALLFPRARTALALASLVPGAVMLLELAFLFVTYFIPITGIMLAPQPFDPMIAVLVGASAALVGVAAFAIPQRVGGFGRASLACTAVAVVGIAATALHFPYTAQRPKRIRLAHVAVEAGGTQKSALLLGANDPLGLASVLPSVPGFVPAGPGWPPYETWLYPVWYEMAAPPPAFPPARVDVISDGYDAATDHRELRLRVRAPGAQFRLGVPAARLVGWSFAARPRDVMAIRGQRMIHFEGLDADGAELSLTINGRAPVPIELRAIDREPARGETVDAVLRRLPPWTTATTATIRMTRLDL